MSFIELFLIGVGLSMDAFAAAICQGLSMTRIKWGHALTVGLYFGGFQALMPFIGWMLGSQFADRIQQYDHWIAFILLVLIGGNMIREALSGDEEDAAQAETDLRLDHKKLFLMAIATSIDALAIGVTFAFLETAILPAIGIIGCTTFCISVAGVAVGCWFGARYKKRAEITGGAILVLLGIKILLEHLGILAF
ncbi:MAG: manganese efflux pump MntP family protein [Oscillibacter sp.]|jgi:putative Mn2+ efflux pump MntP|uniref:manganese efflux pump MntP n=1 Tax=uncultured Dysosmobacter sp. TaxID=2591384 RepID=UPI0026725E4B|nr:manganese efflux pump MntP family protein [Dysosmobacter sp.]MDD6409624.1 manganese efflux pump MntP family protein [Oscillibacter sp.]MDY3866459.1 manganese efflux pump MntP family protein [Dysosmobacter sp.]